MNLPVWAAMYLRQAEYKANGSTEEKRFGPNTTWCSVRTMLYSTAARQTLSFELQNVPCRVAAPKAVWALTASDPALYSLCPQRRRQ